MPTYRDQALVLRRLDYREADRILTLLTRRHGKLAAIARGVRRPTSSLGPALELFAQVDVLLARGRNLDVVAQAVRVPGPRPDPDPERAAHAALVAELADRVSEERQLVPGLFELVASALAEVSRDPEPRRPAAWFMMAILQLGGYGPRLHACAVCERPLPEAEAGFSPAAGGLVCADCVAPGMQEVSVRALKVLRVMASGSIELYRRLKLEPPLLAAVEQVLESQLEYHLDRRLRSLRVVRQMRSA